ncbi:hypothetical protein CFELI_07135 [Corynebacterium felinum]|nr:hypothetical protein CFELI_07135 [Corynebacterium felinum]
MGLELVLTAGELTLLMLGLAALGTAGVAAFGVPLGVEVVAFALISVLMLLFLKPALKSRINQAPKLDTSVKALEGERAVVVESVSSDGGQVRLDGSIWSARALFPDVHFEEGESVHVVSIEGTTAIVWKD